MLFYKLMKKERKKKKITIKNKVTWGGGILSCLSLLSLVCIGYSSWVISKESSTNTNIVIGVAGVTDTKSSYFTKVEVTNNLQYSYSSTNSSQNGLIYDGIIGDNGTISIKLTFDLKSFNDDFSYNYIDFTVTLGYASGITGLSLLNSNTTSTSSSSRKIQSTSSTTTTSSVSTTYNQTSASNSEVISNFKYENSEINALELYLIVNYSFNITSGASEAQTLSSCNGAIFNIKTKASEGNAS